MKFFFSAGEVSGDRFAAGLAAAVTGLDPSIDCVGIGSDAMARAGVRVLADISRTASIGLTESLRHLFPGIAHLRRTRRMLREERPDLLIAVDSQGYNIPLLRAARGMGIPTIYYIPPQNFFWNDRRTCRRVARLSDRILCIYRQGLAMFASLGTDARFVGHPLLDFPSGPASGAASGRAVFLAPGARPQETRRLLPVLLGTASALVNIYPDIRFLASAVSERHAGLLRRAAARSGVPLEVSLRPAGEVLPGCVLYLGKSGTVSLEAALAGVPSVLLYKVSRISYFLLSRVAGLSKRLPFIGLPNLIAGKPVVPELIQGRAAESGLFREARRLLEDGRAREAQHEAFASLPALLGEPGTADRAARAVLDFMNGGRP